MLVLLARRLLRFKYHFQIHNKNEYLFLSRYALLCLVFVKRTINRKKKKQTPNNRERKKITCVYLNPLLNSTSIVKIEREKKVCCFYFWKKNQKKKLSPS